MPSGRNNTAENYFFRIIFKLDKSKNSKKILKFISYFLYNEPNKFTEKDFDLAVSNFLYWQKI